MSVAFRRESDEEHKEPRFELPIPPGPNLVTAAGLRQAEAKVAELEARVAAEADELALADAQRNLRYWRTRLATAELAPPPPADEAAFGSRVRFRLNGQERTVDIVGDDEAAPAAGRIAFSAPLARALIGAGPGDVADFGGAADAIEILAVGAIGG
ncbi:MAG TPA: GreA/GreB family elongation factor [Allosphingosinicella sp.]|nr:GreA/GreB family elongation factor [Allosphingosinicella sp.]